MRIRSIKPEYFDDQRVASWMPLARILYPGLWVMADDAGRFPADLDLIRGAVAKKDRPEHVKAAWDQLVNDRKVLTYEVNGETFGLIVNWWHQRIDKPEPAQRPAPPDDVAEEVMRRALGNARFRRTDVAKIERMFSDCTGNILGMIQEYSRNVPETFRERSRPPRARSREQGAGSREQGAGTPPTPKGDEGGSWEEDFLGKLRKTGKMPALTLEGLLLVMRGFPKAKLAERCGEIVVELEQMPGSAVGSPMQWLRAAMSRLEVRVMREESDAGAGHGGGGGAGGDGPDTSWMKDFAAKPKKEGAA